MLKGKELFNIGKDYMATKSAIYNAYAEWDLAYCWEYCTGWIWENQRDNYDFLKGFFSDINKVKLGKRDSAAVAIQYKLNKKDVEELTAIDQLD